MPSHDVGDAFYGGIVGITHSVSRHPLLSWKASERPLVGIVINIPPVLQCLNSNIKHYFIYYKINAKYLPSSTKSLESTIYTKVFIGGRQ